MDIFQQQKISSEGSNASGIGAFEYDVPNNFYGTLTRKDLTNNGLYNN